MSWPTRVPSMSSASMRTGNAGSGRVRGRWSLIAPRAPGGFAARHQVGRRLDAREPRQAREVGRAPSHRQPGRIAAAAATTSSPWSAPISSSATPSPLERHGEQGQQPPDHVEPVRAPVERQPRLVGELPRQRPDRPGGHVGQVRAHDVPRPVARRQQVGLAERHPVGDPVAHRVLAGEVQGVLARCRPPAPSRARPSAACAGPPPGRRRSPPSRSRRRRPGSGPRRPAAGRRQPGDHRGDRLVDQELRLGSRDERPGIGGDGPPWNSRKPRM